MTSAWDQLESHWIYAPPWKVDRREDPGPDTDSKWFRLMSDFARTIYGGGLWDPAMDPPRKRKRRRGKEMIARYVTSGASILPGEIRLYRMYFEQWIEPAVIAEVLGISENALYGRLTHLRRKAKKHHQRISRT